MLLKQVASCYFLLSIACSADAFEMTRGNEQIDSDAQHMYLRDEVQNVGYDNEDGEDDNEDVSDEDVSYEDVSDEDANDEVRDEDVSYEDANDEVRDEDVSDEDVSDEDVSDEDVSDEDVSDEDVSDEDVSDEDVSDEDVSDEDVSDEDASNEEVSDEDVSDEDVSDEDVGNEEVSYRDAGNEEVSDEEVSDENGSSEDVSDEDDDSVLKQPVHDEADTPYNFMQESQPRPFRVFDFSMDLDIKQKRQNSHISTFVPLLHNEYKRSLFLSPSITRYNSNLTYNIGFVYRNLFDDQNSFWGINMFYDYDSKSNNRRLSEGFELGIPFVRLLGNLYQGQNGWHSCGGDKSREGRPANGYDLKLKMLLPVYPVFTLSARYFSWQGKNVDLYGEQKYVNSPYGLTYEIEYAPFSLVTLAVNRTLERRKGRNDTGIVLRFSYDIASPLARQLRFNSNNHMEPFSQQLFRPVERTYGIVTTTRRDVVRPSYTPPEGGSGGSGDSGGGGTPPPSGPIEPIEELNGAKIFDKKSLARCTDEFLRKHEKDMTKNSGVARQMVNAEAIELNKLEKKKKKSKSDMKRLDELKTSERQSELNKFSWQLEFCAEILREREARRAAVAKPSS